MPFTENEMCEVTENVWTSVLGLTVRPAPAPIPPGGDGDFLSGCVQVTGDWDGAVILACSEAMLRVAAATMFGGDPQTNGAEEMQDALGELTNMVAGNLKALLPGISYLSMPLVAKGLDESLIFPGSQTVRHLTLECDGGHPFELKVLKRTSGP